MHPLIGDLTTLSDEELATKTSDLSKRLNQAYRMGYGDAVQQIQMFLYSYQSEQLRRNEKLMQEISDKNPQFKNIIDIS